MAGLLIGCAVAACAGAGAAQEAPPSLIPTFGVTVRAAEAVGQPVRVGHFTPRLAAAEAFESMPVGSGDAQREVLAVGARWDEVIGAALGFEAAVALSGAVLVDERTRSTEGVAFGATFSTLGVDLSGRYAQRDGGEDDTLSFGATVASGAWTLGGAVSLGLENGAAGGQPGASVEASYALTPGLRVGGVVAFGDDSETSSDASEGGAVAAGMLMRLDF